MKSKKHIIIISLMLVLLVLAGCVQTESSSRPPVETPIKPDKETSFEAEDEPIYDEEFVAVLGRNSIATAYDGVSLELINNSDDDIYLTGGDYNVYCKTEEGYVLIDYDSDGKTKTDEYGKKIINRNLRNEENIANLCSLENGFAFQSGIDKKVSKRRIRCIRRYF